MTLSESALGTYGFTLLDEEQLEAVPEDLRSRIALIRRPRMVVAYENFGNLLLPSAGVFIADEEVDDALKLSEPAAHDRWDPKSKRLDNRDPDERKHVAAIMKRLKQRFQEFARSAVPKPPKGGSRLKFLEQLLGSFFRPPTRIERNLNGVEYDPISVAFSGGPIVQVEPHGLRVTGTVRVLLKSDAEKDEVPIRFEVLCLPVEDDRGSTRDSIRTALDSVDSDYEHDPTQEGSVVLVLRKGEPAHFNFVSDLYDPDWSVNVRPQARETP